MARKIGFLQDRIFAQKEFNKLSNLTQCMYMSTDISRTKFSFWGYNIQLSKTNGKCDLEKCLCETTDAPWNTYLRGCIVVHKV